MAEIVLADFHVQVSLPVLWGDLDALAHVNNVVYFRWFESARIEYFDRVGMGKTTRDQAIGPILASTQCDFKRQLGFPDQVQIGARVSRLGNSSLSLDYIVHSEQLNATAATGTSTIVIFDYVAQKPTPIPDWLRQAIRAIEGPAIGS